VYACPGAFGSDEVKNRKNGILLMNSVYSIREQVDRRACLLKHGRRKFTASLLLELARKAEAGDQFERNRNNVYITRDLLDMIGALDPDNRDLPSIRERSDLAVREVEDTSPTSHLLAAIELEPHARHHYDVLSGCAFSAGDYTECILASERYLQLRKFAQLAGGDVKPVRAGMLHRLAMSHAVLGSYDKAAKAVDDPSCAPPLDQWLVVYTYCTGGMEAADKVWSRQHPDASAVFPGAERRKMLELVWAGVWDLVDYAEKAGMNYAALKHLTNAYRVARDFRSVNSQWSRDMCERIIGDMAAMYGKLPLQPRLTGQAAGHAADARDHIGEASWHKAYRSLAAALEIAPWWAEGHYNAGLIASVRSYPSADAIRHMKTYLVFEPVGKHAETARAKIREWEDEIARLEKQGYSVQEGMPFLIGPDKEY